MPVGFASFREALRAGVEIFHALKSILKKQGLLDRRRRRGRLRAQPQVQRGGARRRHRRHRQGRLHGRRATCASRWTSRPARSGTTSEGTSSRSRARPRGRPSRWSDLWDEWTKQLPDRARSRTASRKATGTAGTLLTEALGRPRAARGRRPVRHQPRDLQEGIDEGIANSILIKLNQIGTVTETLDAMKMAADSRLHRGDLAPLGRDRGLDHRRPRGGHRAPARSRPARRAAPTASRSTTSCSASSRHSAAPRGTPARRRSSS